MVANSKLTILRASTIKKNKNFQNQTKQSKTKTEKKKKEKESATSQETTVQQLSHYWIALIHPGCKRIFLRPISPDANEKKTSGTQGSIH